MNSNQETRPLITIALVVVLVLVLLPVLVMPIMMGGMMAGGMMGSWNSNANAWSGNAPWLWGMLLLWLVLLGGLVFAMAWALRRSTGASTPTNGDATQQALDTLRQRYARGEINKEQYEQIKLDLTGS